MVAAKIPENEKSRLKDLFESGLLDTPQEDDFDEIVKLASMLCNTSISLITLVDSNRQWFKAKVGIDIVETERDVSFCAHAILQDQLFEVPDTLDDIRFSDNPFVVNDPSIRFYAGVPLVASSGSRLGTLCVLDKMPGRLTEMQRFGLKVLANNVMKIADLKIKNKELQYLTDTQKRIISILAHDVRNPLKTIKNIIELKGSDMLDEKDAAYLMDKVAVQLNNTIEMVDNIVNWGQLQLKFGRLQLEDFDIHELVERIFGSEALKSVEKNNELINDIAPGAIIHSDQQALEFILRNLISNANKYTENGSITIAMQQSGIKTILWVMDTGVGMTGQQVNELLNNNTYSTTLGTHKEKGSGLGLLLVKEFIDRMDGSITVKSVINKGTSFKIVI